MMEFADFAQKHRQEFSSDYEFFDWVMMEIQSHMIQIEDLRREKDPAMADEIADLAALACILAGQHELSIEQIRNRARKLVPL